MNREDAVCAVCGRQMEIGEEVYEDPSAGVLCEDCMELILNRRKSTVYGTIDRI